MRVRYWRRLCRRRVALPLRLLVRCEFAVCARRRVLVAVGLDDDVGVGKHFFCFVCWACPNQIAQHAIRHTPHVTQSHSLTHTMKRNDSTQPSPSAPQAKRSRVQKCPYLDTVNRQLLDFDFEKVCRARIPLRTLPFVPCDRTVSPPLLCAGVLGHAGNDEHLRVHGLRQVLPRAWRGDARARPLARLRPPRVHQPRNAQDLLPPRRLRGRRPLLRRRQGVLRRTALLTSTTCCRAHEGTAHMRHPLSSATTTAAHRSALTLSRGLTLSPPRSTCSPRRSPRRTSPSWARSPSPRAASLGLPSTTPGSAG